MKSFKYLLYLSVMLVCAVFLSSFTSAKRNSKHKTKTKITLNYESIYTACKENDLCKGNDTLVHPKKRNTAGNKDEYVCLCTVYKNLESNSRKNIYLQVNYDEDGKITSLEQVKLNKAEASTYTNMKKIDFQKLSKL